MPTTVTLHLPEQDHRTINRIIRPMMGFKDFRYARIILSGIEIAHMIRKELMQNDGGTNTAAEKFYSLLMWAATMVKSGRGAIGVPVLIRLPTSGKLRSSRCCAARPS